MALREGPLMLAVEESDSTLLLRLGGDFDLAGVGAVENALDRLSQAHPPRRVVFDLRGLAFLGTAGLRTILRTDARGRATAFEVVVVRPRGRADRIFTLTRAGERLSMVDQPEAGWTIATEVKEDRRHRLVNQRRLRHYFVECSCALGCSVCAYTGLVSKAQAKHTSIVAVHEEGRARAG
jgi:anti-anti-sigma factor